MQHAVKNMLSSSLFYTLIGFDFFSTGACGAADFLYEKKTKLDILIKTSQHQKNCTDFAHKVNLTFCSRLETLLS